MVTINLTIVVQLVLFLLFLWAANTLVFRPVLRRLDEREHYVEQNATAAKEDAKAAESLESEYAVELSTVRRAATVRFEREREAAMDERNQRLARARQDGDQAVMAVEREGKAQIEAQRSQFDVLAAEISDLMAKRLYLKGGAS
jgi:F-type H+-transporting ATPase subunit b